MPMALDAPPRNMPRIAPLSIQGIALSSRLPSSARHLAPGAVSHFDAPCIFLLENLRKYTGWCIDDFTAPGATSTAD